MDKEHSYTIGIDFGTLSARAAVVRVSDGKTLGTAVHAYESAVMDKTLSCADGQELPADFALQNASDYIRAIKETVPAALQEAGVSASEVIALGVDTTSASVVFAAEDGTPMSEIEQFRNNPHAYVKLWKHHGAAEQADRIQSLAAERQEKWLARYGGIISSELLLPKALEVFEKAPEVYKATGAITAAMDWINWRLTGVHKQSAGPSGYKRIYQDGEYPSTEYLEALAEGFGDVYEQKMSAPIVQLAEPVAGLSEEAAEWTGLKVGTTVVAGSIDAHAHALGVNAIEDGVMTIIAGTSSVLLVSDKDFHFVPGVFGTVDGGICPGKWGYEAGQTAVGDIFGWFKDTFVPLRYYEEADEKGINVHDLLTQKAMEQNIGEHGLVALDWHNGNRSILSDPRLAGMVLGKTLSTQPEDIYRALIEASIFGGKTIIDNFVEHGVEIKEVVIAGGLLKNPIYTQGYADVTGLPISISATEQAGALGSAIFAAVAAGAYEDVYEAAAAMGKKIEAKYKPIPENVEAYRPLYETYRELHDYFGRENTDIMHRLRKIRNEARSK